MWRKSRTCGRRECALLRSSARMFPSHRFNHVLRPDRREARSSPFREGLYCKPQFIIIRFCLNAVKEGRWQHCQPSLYGFRVLQLSFHCDEPNAQSNRSRSKGKPIYSTPIHTHTHTVIHRTEDKDIGNNFYQGPHWTIPRKPQGLTYIYDLNPAAIISPRSVPLRTVTAKLSCIALWLFLKFVLLQSFHQFHPFLNRGNGVVAWNKCSTVSKFWPTSTAKNMGEGLQ